MCQNYRIAGLFVLCSVCLLSTFGWVGIADGPAFQHPLYAIFRVPAQWPAFAMQKRSLRIYLPQIRVHGMQISLHPAGIPLGKHQCAQADTQSGMPLSMRHRLVRASAHMRARMLIRVPLGTHDCTTACMRPRKCKTCDPEASVT